MEELPGPEENSLKYQLMPIGGVGEVGHNMMLIKTTNEWIIIDCGVLFPHDNFLGLQYLIPNFTLLEENRDKVTTLIITHAHEDHIGAVPFLWMRLPHLKILAPPMAKELILLKTKQYLGNAPLVDKHTFPSLEQLEGNISTYNHGNILTFQDVTIYPVSVNHSIPHTHGLIIQDKEKEVSSFYASDCKYDADSPYETAIDFDYINKITKSSKIKFLLLDSTNILRTDKTPSEKNLIKPLNKIIKNLSGRIFVTFFPSNLHRLQTFINLAKILNRKLVYYGRSLKTYSEIGFKLQLINHLTETRLTELSDDLSSSLIQATPDNEILVLLTGCQGDYKGALNRVVSGQDPLFKLREGDTIIFSSRVIPGNEKKIAQIYNKIYQQGAKIITANDELIHVSGHPGQEDIKIFVKKIAPTHFVPIHGENYFLYKHAEFINHHFPSIKTYVINNYDAISITSNFDIEHIKGNELRNLLPPSFVLEDNVIIDKGAINRRKKLASKGVVFISVVLFKNDTPPQIKIDFFGLPAFIEGDHYQEELCKLIDSQIKTTTSEQDMVATIARYLTLHLNYRPIIRLHLITQPTQLTQQTI
ncbi:MAG: ribonuclease J [Oligoflexia bacterium]|nr:ribonuclease J [Oligoflexia bacterium]